MSTHSLQQSKPTFKRQDVENNFDGNLCRCTGYRPIMDAFKALASDASEELKRKAADGNSACNGCPMKINCCQNKDIEDIECCPGLSHVYVTLKSGEEWITATSLVDVYKALQRFTERGIKYRIVAGNTGTVPELKRSMIEPYGVKIGANVTLCYAMDQLQKASEIERVHATQTENFLFGKNLDKGALIKTMDTLEAELKPDHNPTEGSTIYRKTLAQSLLYKTILSILGDSVKAPLRSGGQDLEHGPMSGQQTFDSDQKEWPLYQPIPKIEAAVQASGGFAVSQNLLIVYYDKVKGEAEYINDIDPEFGELFGAFVLTTVANATISSIDASEALVYVYTWQAVGLILAESRAIALEAAKKVRIVYSDVKKPVLDMKDSLKLAEKKGENCILEIRKTSPSGDEKGTQTIKGEFRDGMDVFCATQYPDLVQSVVASAIGVPNHFINLIVRRLGGGYGAKILKSCPTAAACAVAAHVTNRPVRIATTSSDLDTTEAEEDELGEKDRGLKPTRKRQRRPSSSSEEEERNHSQSFSSKSISIREEDLLEFDGSKYQLHVVVNDPAGLNSPTSQIPTLPSPNNEHQVAAGSGNHYWSSPPLSQVDVPPPVRTQAGNAEIAATRIRGVTLEDIYLRQVALERMVANGISDIRQDIRTLLLRTDDANSSVENSVVIPVNLPLENESDVLILEDWLKEKDNCSKLVEIFKRNGGKSALKVVTGILASTLTKGLAEKINYVGTNGKTAFNNLKLNRLVIEATLASEFGKKLTISEIVGIIQRWLGNAKDLDGGRTSRKTTNVVVPDEEEEG
ncbi:putative aldehyde oxidase 1 [Folsomia candida]|uniref:Putative aldehyde oxidase 1 n=1 Tax=Folsomia candida TaxID=158441 RepID=A0A226D542_FOLCA|nr:putative aldehyde oxidase 1 [Folsomia candida]